jgi:hypothetical protein
VLAALLLASTALAGGARHSEAPSRLADTGLYMGPGTHVLARGVRTWTPQYPLWSDGASKRRWILLPPGRSIDASDPDAWVFPVGTRLWKEFPFEERAAPRLRPAAAPADTLVQLPGGDRRRPAGHLRLPPLHPGGEEPGAGPAPAGCARARVHRDTLTSRVNLASVAAQFPGDADAQSPGAQRGPRSHILDSRGG